MAERIVNDETGQVLALDPNTNEWYLDHQATMINQMPWYEKALVGAGRSLTQAGRGVADIFTDLEPQSQAEEQAWGQLQEAAPVATGIGQALPYLAAAPLGGATALGQGALYGTLGGLGTEGDIGDRVRAAVIQGGTAAAGAGLFNMAGRVINRVRGVTRDLPGVAGQAVKRGARLTPGEVTGSSMLKRAEAPLGSWGVLDPIRGANQKNLQRVVSKAIGQKKPDLTPAGLGNAADDIGQQINNAVAGKSIKVADDIPGRLSLVKNESPFVDFPNIHKTMTGKTYQQIRSQLSGVARAEARSATKTPGKLEHVNSLIDDLDDAFMRSAGSKAGRELRQAREHWRNLLAIERGRAVGTDGTVNAPSLQNAMVSTWGKTMRRAKMEHVMPETRDMMKLVNAHASPALRSLVGESGTAVRAGAGLGAPVLGAIGGGVAGGDLQSAALGASLGLGLRYGYMPLGQMLTGAAAPGAGILGGGLAAGLYEAGE